MVVQERKLVHSDIKPENLPRTYQTCPGSRPSSQASGSKSSLRIQESAKGRQQ